jgi:hypothetical protein
MKDNYDFSQGKRGAVVPIEPHQIRVTLSLDKDIINWFRSKVPESGGGDYHKLDLLHKSEKLTISNFGFWILDFGLRDLGLLQEVY